MGREYVESPSNGHSNGRDRNCETTSSDRSLRDKDGEKLVYRPRGHNDIVAELHPENLKCLAPGKYLNDEVIQFYTRYLLSECCESPKKIHVFDNIFHNILAETFFEKGIDQAKWKMLNKWFNGLNIFDKDFLIFPICQEEHWFTIVVCYPNEVRDVESSICTPEPRNKPVPGIMVLDSLNLKKPLLTKEVRFFLDFEWRSRLTVIKDFSFHNLKQFHPELPKQTNAFDCGIFMLAYLRSFIIKPERFYRLVKKSPNKDYDAELVQMINSSLALCGREAIKNQIYRLCQLKKSKTS